MFSNVGTENSIGQESDLENQRKIRLITAAKIEIVNSSTFPNHNYNLYGLCIFLVALIVFRVFCLIC